MLTLEKRIQRWKKWVNRNKQFSIEELEEMENHLREEILYLTVHDNIPDQKAFDQALDILGEKGLLDEEFGKIRKSKFDKVKLWAFLQTFLILGLVMILIAPYIYIPKNTFAGERIGSIFLWSKEMSDYGIQNIITNEEGFFFRNPNDNNVYIYKKVLFQPSPTYRLNGTYFSATTALFPEIIKIPKTIFDIDAQDRMYCINYSTYMIDVYYKGLLEKSLPIPYTRQADLPFTVFSGLKIIDNKLVLISLEPNRETTLSQDHIMKDVDFYLAIYDLNSNLTLLDKKIIKNTLSIDRSKNILAILSSNGEISTYAIENNKIKLLKEWKIKNPLSYQLLGKVIISFSNPGPSLTMLFSEKNNQIVLKDNTKQNSYYELVPTEDGYFKLIPITNKNVTGVIKIIYQNEERLALVIKDKKEARDGYDSLYLFKD